MSKEKRRVPKLRFPGFTEDWEQRKLGSLATVEMNKRIFKEQTTIKGDIPFYKIGTFGSDADSFISRELFKEYKNKYPYPNIGDILISASGSIGRTVVYNGEDAYYQDSNIVWLNHNGKIDNSFLLQFYNQVKWAGLEGSTIKRLYNKNILETNIALPKIEEQRLIGKFFELVDRSITLHQRKLNNLKLKKKALLQKLFPKNEERYPELRFPGFTDAWEQCKLSVLATMNARIGWQNLRTSEFLDNGDYLLITGTDFDNGRIKYSTCHYVEKKRFDQDTKIQLSTGSILITKDGTLGKVALVEELPKPATLNAGVFNVRVKDDAFLSYKYLYHYLKAPFLMKYVTANATGGTIKHLNQSILVDFPIPITGKQEQDRIAKLLDSLESIITLHQRKLDHLQLQKKALLQQMFV